MASTVAPVELSLVERIVKLEEGLKELKRCARQELKARRRRGTRVPGEKTVKGETPEQLKAWHEEVRKVWEEMRVVDAKTPYKRAVAEASARRKGSASGAPVAAVAPVAEKKSKKASASAATSAAAPVAASPVAAEAPKKRASKKTA
jgi:hypothetical protein